MHIVFAVADPHLPHLIGGGPMDIHHMALALCSRQHEPTVVAALPGGRRRLGRYRLRQALSPGGLPVSRDVTNGYPTLRAAPWLVPRVLAERIEHQRPDVVIVQGGGIERLAPVAIEHGVPVVMRSIDTASVELLAQAADRDPEVGSLLRSPLFTIVSISDYVGGRVRDLLGLSSTVIRPLIRVEDSVARPRRPEHITFVNPIPFKGLTVALRVAALLPQRRFLFAEAWNRPAWQRKELGRALAAVPNVTFRQRSTGLSDVYRSTALVLMPSQGPEGFGRVVIEAGINGIPVVASRVGGLPEALGTSGVLLDAGDPAERWAESIEQILSTPENYSRFEAAALANARREELQENVITRRFLEVCAALSDPAAGPRRAAGKASPGSG